MKKIQKGKITSSDSWRAFFQGSFLSYYDLTGDLTLTIKEMRYEDVTGPGGRKEPKLVAHFTNNDVLPMVINTTNAKTITDLHGTNKPAEWAGKSIIIYAEPNVRFAGETVGGLRVRPVKPTLKKKTLPAERFEAMIKQIKAGNFDKSKASQFALTPEQEKELQAI